MQNNLDQSRCQQFFELNWVMSANQEDMSVLETAVWLLSHLQGIEARAIDEFERGVDGPILWLRLERDVFEGDQVDLHRIQLFPVEIR